MNNIGADNNKVLAEKFLASLGKGDVKAALSATSDNFEYRVMSVNIQVYNKELFVKTMADFSAFMKRHVAFTVIGTAAEGDRVSVEAEGDGLTATGKSYRNRYHFVFEFRNGRIAYVKEYMDTAYAGQFFAPA